MRVVPDCEMLVPHGTSGPLVVVREATGVEHLDDGRDGRGGHEDQMLRQSAQSGLISQR